MGKKGQPTSSSSTTPADTKRVEITIWRLEKDRSAKAAAPKAKPASKKAPPPPPPKWQRVFSDLKNPPSDEDSVALGEILFTVSRELLKHALQQDSDTSASQQPGQTQHPDDSDEDPFEGFVRSAQPAEGDLAMRVRHVLPAQPGGTDDDKTLREAVHHLPHKLVDDCRLIAVGVETGKMKVESWRFFEHRSSGKSRIKVHKPEHGKPRSGSTGQSLAEVAQCVGPSLGRIIVTRKTKSRPAKAASNPAAPGDSDEEPPKPFCIQVFGRYRAQLSDDPNIYYFGRYDIDSYDLGALDYADSQDFEDDLRAELNEFQKKARLFSRNWTPENDRKAVRFAVDARKLLEDAVPDHASFAALVKGYKDEILRDRIARSAENQTNLRALDSGSLGFLITDDEIENWDKFIKDASKDRLKQIGSALDAVDQTAWDKLGVKSPEAWNSWLSDHYQNLVRMGVPSPEASPYAPFHLIGMVGSVMTGETDQSKVWPGGAPDELSNGTLGLGATISGLEIVSCVTEFAYLCFAQKIIDNSIEKIDVTLNDPNTSQSEKDELTSYRETLKAQAADLGKQAVIVIGKSSVALLSTVKSLYDIIKPITDTTVDLATDAFSAILGSAAGAIGTVISVYVLVTQSHAIRRTQRRFKAIDKVKTHYKSLNSGDPDYDPVLLQYMRYGSHKLRRKRGQHIGRAVSAGLGVVGGGTGTLMTVLVATGTVAAANAWNPVGWAIGGVGLAIGVGLSVYMIHRRVKKSKLRKKREATGKPLDKTQFVATLATAYADQDFHDTNKRQWDEVATVLGKLSALKYTQNVPPGDFPGQYLDMKSAIKIGASKL